MTDAAHWQKFFKTEVVNRGQEEFEKGLASISTASDTRIQAYVKAMPLIKVTFAADSIASPDFTADCSCSAAAKGVLCRHIWAVLMLVQKTHPDFLDSKTTLEKAQSPPKTESPFKAKQAAYQKQQSEKQKRRAKEQRLEIKMKKKGRTVEPRYPSEVVEALEFFSLNGFPMQDSIDEEALKKAKKELAWVFHPDRGGSHDESVILNHHYETLLRFLGT